MSILNRFLQKWVAWVLPRPRFILAAALVTVIASIWVAAVRLEVQTDQLELISTRHPLIALQDQLEPFNFHGKATFAVVVRGPTQERAIEFMKALVERIHKDPQHYQDVFYRIDPEQFKKWVLYYLDQDELVNIRKRIEDHSDMVRNMAEDPDLLSFFKLVNQEMASRMVGEFFTGFLDDDTTPKESGNQQEPMDLEFLIKVLEGLSNYLAGNPQYVSPWASFFKSGAWDLEKEGYLWEGKKKFLVAAVMPKKIKEGVSKTQISLTALRKEIHDLRASSFTDVQAGVTGQDALNNDEMSTAMKDMTTATWLSLCGVLLLMVFFFRGLRHPIIITVSLAVGLCWTFGWTALFIGHLNILSIVFAPLLCGLGVDYAIHWFARFEEERDKIHEGRAAIIRRVMDTSGPGILLAGISAAFSFLPFILTGFRGLMELGMVTGMGILLTLLADFTVLPALSYYFAADKTRKNSRAGASTGRQDLLRLGRGGVRAVLASALLLTLVGAFGASRVQFDLNPLRLQSDNAEAVYWEKLLVENSDHSVLSAAAFAESGEQAKEISAKMKALPSVSDVATVFALLPEHQEEKIPVLRSILASVPDLDQSIRRLREGPSYASLAATVDPHARTLYLKELAETLERIRFKMQDDQADKWGASKPLVEQMARVRSLSGDVVQAIQDRPDAPKETSEYRQKFKDDIVDKWSLLKESSSAPPMRIEDIPQALKDQFFQNGQYLIRVYPKESILEEGALSRFVTDIRSVEPNVVGDPVSLFVFSSAFKKASIAASIYALIAISLLLLFTFRSLKLTLISLIPLTAGTIWTVGIMGATGIDFNLANSIFMPLVVGAGVEYGVIILHRWREGRVGYGRLPFSTGKGVILAALTTTLGFGALMISHHRGIFSLGFVAWAGSICVLVSALFILPAILSGMNAPQPAIEEGETEHALQ
ncbi:MAG: MMPL family transporter [Syntrophobacteraceae bacterium]